MRTDRVHEEEKLVNRQQLASGEIVTPHGDWVLGRALDHEEKTAGGIVMPEPGDYDTLKTEKYQKQHTPDREIRRNDPQALMRVAVMAAGPGMSIDVASDHSGEIFARKPMCAKEGAVVLVQKRMCLQVTIGGEVLAAFHDFAVMATLHKGPAGDEQLEAEHDYVFCRPAQMNSMQVTKGGIVMPELQDPTGLRSAMPDRWEAIGVGQGAWALRYERGKPPAFERRPAPVAPGDVFLFEGSGLTTALFGAPMLIIQAFQVAATMRPVAMGNA